MNFKQIAGLGIAAVGIFLIGYGFYSKNDVSSAKDEIRKIAKSKNRILKSVGKDMETRVKKHGSRTNWYFFGGGVLIVLGGAAVYFYRRK